MSTRREFLALSAGAVLASAAAQTVDQHRPPNIIIVFCDDLGYGDLGCFGAEDIRTPNIDRLAAEGTRLTDFYSASPICSPSRAGLLTGCYPARIGMAKGVLRPDSRVGINPQETTLAEILKSAGYATGCIGKWHVGFLPPSRPTARGFDFYYGLYHNLDVPEASHFADVGGVPIMRNDAVDERPASPDTITEKYTAEALAYIRQHRDRPFFLYLAHTMPHDPIGASERFRGKSARGLYGDVIECLDWSTGEISGLLRELGIERETILLFTSDNGHSPTDDGSAGPLRGLKHTTYEGGMRVPCIVWGPGRIPAGRVNGDMLATLDLLPTFATIAGAPLRPRHPIDGLDASAFLLGGARSPRDTVYYWHGNGQLEAIRQGSWKFSRRKDGPELYNLATDIGEQVNLVESEPARAAALGSLLDEHAQEIRDTARPAGLVDTPD